MHILIHTVSGTLYMHSSICSISNAHTNTHSYSVSERERERERQRDRERQREYTHLLHICTPLHVLQLYFFEYVHLFPYTIFKL